MQQLLSEFQFIGQRFDGGSIIDILLVAAIIFVFLRFIKGSQANTLLRGSVTIFILLALFYFLVDLPAFTWLIGNIFPVFLIVIPVVYAPEIRRAFERMGQVQTIHDLFASAPPHAEEMIEIVDAVVTSCSMLSARSHGALIVLQRFDNLDKYIQTGVFIDSVVTPELMLQIFYPNTPLHDGAVIIQKGRIQAAACVMPLSSRNVLDKTPGRSMGLRHRAALGTSEANDSITIVVSEETGTISVAHEGKITRDVSNERLKVILEGMYALPEEIPLFERIVNFINYAYKKLIGGEKK